MTDKDDLGLQELGPDYYHQFTDEEILRRCQVRSERFARLWQLEPVAGFVLQREHELLEGAYQEWLRRQSKK